MVTENLRKELESLPVDLSVVTVSSNFNRIKSAGVVFDSWDKARELAELWIRRVRPVLPEIEDASVRPLINFARRVVNIAEGLEVRPDEAIMDTLRRVTADFQKELPLIAFEVLEASGVLTVSKDNLDSWRVDAVNGLNSSAIHFVDEVRTEVAKAETAVRDNVTEAIDRIKEAAVEAGKDFELAKERSSKISVGRAQEQFNEAAKALRIKAAIWIATTTILSLILVGLLVEFYARPPLLVRYIEDSIRPGSKNTFTSVSIPLLIAASAYFTGIRLALVGVLSVGFAFSLRMIRAYLHMIEHNNHKLRVTNSIEAFVAAVRTNEQKDLVLSKLVESVTEFGESGILVKEDKSSNLPSVLFETITKNVSKSD